MTMLFVFISLHKNNFVNPFSAFTACLNCWIKRISCQSLALWSGLFVFYIGNHGNFTMVQILNYSVFLKVLTLDLDEGYSSLLQGGI